MKFKLIIVLLFLSHSLFSQLEYELFNGKKGKISFNKEYSYANLYDYKINASKEDSIIARKLSSTIPEGLLTDQYIADLSNNKQDSISFEIVMNSRLLVDINAERICLIKYKTRTNATVSEDKIFQAVKTGEDWKELTNSNEEIQLLEQILHDTNVNILFQFYNYRDDPEYADINSLKPQVKDDKGIINIKKLAEVVSKNNTALQKYIKE